MDFDLIIMIMKPLMELMERRRVAGWYTVEFIESLLESEELPDRCSETWCDTVRSVR